MATIHIKEIQSILANRGEKDARQWNDNGEGYFLEIRFDNPTQVNSEADDEMKNKVITAICAYGLATIQFDENGSLRSIDLS